MGEFYCREMHSVTFPGTFCAYEYTIMTPTKTIGGKFFFGLFSNILAKKFSIAEILELLKFSEG